MFTTHRQRDRDYDEHFKTFSAQSKSPDGSRGNVIQTMPKDALEILELPAKVPQRMYYNTLCWKNKKVSAARDFLDSFVGIS